jgi:hypothetical protein
MNIGKRKKRVARKKTMYARGKKRGTVRTVVWRKNTRGKASWQIRTGKGFRKYSGRKYGTRARAKASWPKKQRKKTVRRVKRRGAARNAGAASRAEVWGRQAKAAGRYERTTGPEPAEVDFGRRFRRNGRFGAQNYRGLPQAASLLGKDYFGPGQRMTQGEIYTGQTEQMRNIRMGLDGDRSQFTIPKSVLSSFYAANPKGLVSAQGGMSATDTAFGRRRMQRRRRPMRFF